MRPDATAEEIVDYLNRNTSRLMAWEARSAEISGRGAARTPVSVKATIAVEAPRNFRLIASGPIGGKEVDLGSNQDNFWFWSKRNEQKYVFTAKHEQETGRLPTRFPIPFQPDWIMEALGVVAIDPEGVSLQPGRTGSRTVQLVSHATSPQGEPVIKVTVVDLCHGIVKEHSLYSESGKPIARAILSQHIRDKATQLVVPTRVDLDWPKAELGLTITLGTVEVNPRQFQSRTWTVPDIPGYQVMDLSR